MIGKLSAALAGGAVALGPYRARQPKPLGIHYSDAPTKVLVLGGGFGGLAAVRRLAQAFEGSRDVGVALLDRVNYTTFWPMVPAAISGDIEVRHVASSIRRILKSLGAAFFQAEVVGVDFDAREVHSDVGSFSYDYLILAPGSRTAFFGTSGARENAMDLKGLRDALRVCNAIIDRFEEAERRLASQRVDIIDNVKAQEVKPDAVVLSDGSTIPARTTIWAAGVEPPPLVKDLDVRKDSRGHIVVDELLRVTDRPGVYAVGDCTSVKVDGHHVPALAQAAEQEGAAAARNVAAQIRGEDPTPFRYRHLGQFVDLGTTSALGDILGVRFSSLLGALVWKGVYLYELGYNLNRARVLTDWAVDFFARPDTYKIMED